MNVNQKEIKKYMYLISFAGVVLAIILNLSQVFHFIQTIWKLIVPFFVGFCIAFVLNIITKQLENTLLKNSKNKRMFSFIITLILLFAFIILICFIVGPELVHSIKEIIIKLKAATAPHSLFGYDKDETLYATDRLEYFFDNYTFDDLRKSGILVISAMCEMD